MTTKHFEELTNEISASMKDGRVAEKDHTVLEQVQAELQSVLSTSAPAVEPSHRLRDKLTRAIEQLEGQHPRLTSLLSKSLELLSDVGI